MMTIEQRRAIAASRHAAGCNCAQSVALAFADLFPDPVADAAAAERMLCGFGLGCGDMGRMCGAFTGANAACGLIRYAGPAAKPQAYGRARRLQQEFIARHGAIVCRDLKGGRHSCPELIAAAVEILDNLLRDEAQG